MNEKELTADQYIDHWIKNKVWTHLNWPKHQLRFKTIAGYLEGKTAIDIGCAFGHSTMHLTKYWPGYWHGLDFSMRAIDKAKALFPAIPFFYATDFNLYNHLGEIYDSVVCSEVIEHVDDDRGLIKGLQEITKDVLVITTPNRRVSDPGHLRIYNESMLIDLFFGRCSKYEIHNIDPFFYVVVRP
jgi:2-polyprenyl-3-methyl-5-hydroxy-6-metoxy-1,4-benzoquinol methylase